MSEIPDRDISEAATIPAMLAMPPNVPGTPQMDFGPLIDDDEDVDLTPLPAIVRPRRRRWIRWLVLGLLVILLGGGGFFAYERTHQPTPVQYTQATVTTGNLSVTVSGSGPVEPKATYDLNFSSSTAIVKSINVHVGQHVKKGTLLATLDPTSLQNTVMQAQQAVNADQASLNQANASLSSTKSQEATAIAIAALNKRKALDACVPGSTPTPAGSPTPTTPPDTDATATAEANCRQLAEDTYTQAVQQANAAIASAQNAVATAQEKLTTDGTTLKQDQDALKNASLFAPESGLIDAINGQVAVTPSSSSPFIVLVDASTLSVAAQVSESDISSVAVNQPATFTVSAYPSQTFRASVTSINTQGSSSSSVVSYTVNLAVDLQSLGTSQIYPGMTATVNITTAQRIGVLLVPVVALSFLPTAIQKGELSQSALSALTNKGTTAPGGGQGIVVELKNGKLVPVLVTTGLTNGQQTEILSGLKEGDQVVVGQTGGPTGNSTPGAGGPGGSGPGPVGPGSGGSTKLCTPAGCS